MSDQNKTISIIIPAYNEASNLEGLFAEILKNTTNLKYKFEYIFINDGSEDDSYKILKNISLKNDCVRIINFSRNFGKEMATTAGINNCTGDACIIMDADLQHPPKYIKDLIYKWKDGADVVVGVRNGSKSDTFIKRVGSKYFYKIINRIADTKMIPNSTDYRLIDRQVIDEFNKLNEHNRITRGLIDWLGFERDVIYFEPNERSGGKGTYSTLKLIKLAFNSMISLSLFPLKLAGYLGILITFLSGIMGILFFIEKYLLNGVFGINISPVASLAIIIVFLVGIIMICLGLISLYIANIHGEVINRPKYIIRKDRKVNE